MSWDPSWEDFQEKMNIPGFQAASDQDQKAGQDMMAKLLAYAFAIQECLENEDHRSALVGGVELVNLMVRVGEKSLINAMICALGQVMQQMRYRLLPDGSVSELNDFLIANRDAVTFVGSMSDYRLGPQWRNGD